MTPPILGHVKEETVEQGWRGGAGGGMGENLALGRPVPGPP